MARVASRRNVPSRPDAARVVRDAPVIVGLANSPPIPSLGSRSQVSFVMFVLTMLGGCSPPVATVLFSAIVRRDTYSRIFSPCRATISTDCYRANFESPRKSTMSRLLSRLARSSYTRFLVSYLGLLSAVRANKQREINAQCDSSRRLLSLDGISLGSLKFLVLYVVIKCARIYGTFLYFAHIRR